MTLQDLINTINEDPSQVREALELIKRQLPAYPEATEAADADFIPLTKAGGGTEKLPLPILDQRSVTPLSDVTALSSLDTATLVDGQQFSVRDGGKVRYFSWDEGAGNFVEILANGGVFESVAEMRSSERIQVGQIVKTSGYYSAGDGGGNDYEIVEAGTDTHDGGSFIDLDNGLQARGLFPGGVMRARQWGISDDADYADELEAMWVFADGRPTRIDVNTRTDRKIELNDVSVDCRVDDGVNIDCANIPAGASLGDQFFLQASGSIADTADVTADVQPFAENRNSSEELDSYVDVSDGTKFQPGDICILRSDQLFDDAWTGGPNNKRGEMLRVSSVAGNRVFFHDKIKFSYLSAQNCVLEKTAPIKFSWCGGMATGGGTGAAHSFLRLDLCEAPQIYTRCDYFEDVGYRVNRCYGGRGDVVANYCTSPTHLGNTGYGIVFTEGSRYCEFTVNGVRCRHIVSGGGRLPALDIKIKGHAVDCGIGTEAWDTHEPCFGWEFDVTAEGGRGGAVMRGSDIKIDLYTKNCAGGLRIRTFGAVTEQRDVHFNLKARNVQGSCLDIQAVDAPIKNISFGYIDVENVRLSGLNIAGEVDGVRGDIVRVDGTWLWDGETSSSGAGIRLHGEAYNVGDRVRNVSIGEATILNTVQAGIEGRFVDGFYIGKSEIDGGAQPAAFFEDCERIFLPDGTLKSSGDGAPLRTTRVDVIKTSCELIATGGTVDGWRGVDTTNAMLNSSPNVDVTRHAMYVSGTSDNVIVTGNNFVNVPLSVKLNRGDATNVVEENNLI